MLYPPAEELLERAISERGVTLIKDRLDADGSFLLIILLRMAIQKGLKVCVPSLTVQDCFKVGITVVHVTNLFLYRWC